VKKIGDYGKVKEFFKEERKYKEVVQLPDQVKMHPYAIVVTRVTKTIQSSIVSTHVKLTPIDSKAAWNRLMEHSKVKLKMFTAFAQSNHFDIFSIIIIIIIIVFLFIVDYM
jgi:hypothetical protein